MSQLIWTFNNRKDLIFPNHGIVEDLTVPCIAAPSGGVAPTPRLNQHFFVPSQNNLTRQLVPNSPRDASTGP